MYRFYTTSISRRFIGTRMAHMRISFVEKYTT